MRCPTSARRSPRTSCAARPARRTLPLEPPAFYAEHAIAARTGEAATALDPAAATVTLSGGEVLAYDACVLVTGARPARLPVPGADDERVLVLRSLAEARTLRARAARARRAVVIGSGFIGCEAAASLATRGLEVTLVSDEDIPHASRLGEEAGARIAGWLRDLGVSVHLGAAVERIEDGRTVHAGRPLEADLVLMAAGMEPQSQIAAAAGIDVEAGRVVTDASMRTSAPGVLAAGDLALAHNAAAGRRLAVEHWGEALAMGEVAGRTAAGAQAQWAQAPGFWSTIGEHTLKHVAWGDGYDSDRLVDHGDGAFTVWYGREGVCVGVLCHEADEDYETGRKLIEAGAPLP